MSTDRGVERSIIFFVDTAETGEGGNALIEYFTSGELICSLVLNPDLNKLNCIRSRALGSCGSLFHIVKQL